ncbi:MAG: pyruvate kinase [Actinomycetes bacterium]
MALSPRESNFLHEVQAGSRRPPYAGRRTRIIATIGPASEDSATLKAMAAAGMDVARVSLSHGSIEESIAKIRRIREAVPGIGILADLPGPKVRSTPFVEDGVEFHDGGTVRLTLAAETPESNGTTVGVVLDEGFGSLKIGDTIVLGDGGIALVVSEVGDTSIVTNVASGGHVQGRPGVTIPSHALSLPTPTPEDVERIAALIAEDVEAIAVSFVRSPADIAAVRVATGSHPCLIVAKIETQEAVDDLDGIVRVADSVMVARGDLGVRLPIEDVPSLQKQIIRSGVRFGRPAITATQMLESMIHAKVPTRAEVTDVANAVLDGTSAVMLSAETAIGENPALVIETIDRILRRAERDFDYAHWGASLGVQEVSGDRASALRITAAITGAGWRAALEEDAAAIVAFSASGATVRAISRFRPSMPILAVTTTEYRASQLRMSWGVASVLVHDGGDPRGLTAVAIDHLLAVGLAKPGDVILVLSGSHDSETPATDTVRLARIPTA